MIIPVNDFYVFIINEICFKPRIMENIDFRYRRMLEKELFKPYIKELNRTRKKYIIHFWKLDTKNKTANIIVSFEKEKSVRILSTFALTMNLVIGLLFAFSDNNFKFNEFFPVLLIIMTIFILILILPLWSRTFTNKYWISRVNKL
jgi:hypothetical protein